MDYIRFPTRPPHIAKFNRRFPETSSHIRYSFTSVASLTPATKTRNSPGSRKIRSANWASIPAQAEAIIDL